jgi:hypothetical protein
VEVEVGFRGRRKYLSQVLPVGVRFPRELPLRFGSVSQRVPRIGFHAGSAGQGVDSVNGSVSLVRSAALGAAVKIPLYPSIKKNSLKFLPFRVLLSVCSVGNKLCPFQSVSVKRKPSAVSFRPSVE